MLTFFSNRREVGATASPLLLSCFEKYCKYANVIALLYGSTQANVMVHQDGA
ncbi:hypothetical protein [Chlamydia gallinacea]|uniref:Uncharacterized protein n=1 Tax=Chlamydia gallinacea TaxID=1457153 RepID=A0ABS7IQV4_9CHLA|nr:hypothetical protein [Chlamydia gallinacea]EYE60568.1 hypothetical protein M127_5400 [Bacteroides fragilis str. S6L5]MBX6679967.1 hypothetical protein [Chlamydia gallinacea]